MFKSSIGKKVLGGLMLTLLMAACKSTPLVQKPAVEDKSPSAASSQVTPPASTIAEVNTDNMSGTGLDASLTDANNILSKRKVYFDYDQDAVKAEYRELITAHAKYLAAHSSAKVILQGNTDERGTREYNLSLGQRRAVAVKNALNTLGVTDAQIETISYGEEKAKLDCAGNTCYAEDRRVDIVYVGE